MQQQKMKFCCVEYFVVVLRANSIVFLVKYVSKMFLSSFLLNVYTPLSSQSFCLWVNCILFFVLFLKNKVAIYNLLFEEKKSKYKLLNVKIWFRQLL